MWCKRLTLEKCISFRMKWFFSPPFLSVSPFLLLNLARRQSYAYAIGLYTRPEIKSWPDVKFCVHAQCVLPQCSLTVGARVKERNEGGRPISSSLREVSTWRFREQIARSKKTATLQATHTKTLRQTQTKTNTSRLRTSAVPRLPFMLITAIRSMNLLHFATKASPCCLEK